MCRVRVPDTIDISITGRVWCDAQTQIGDGNLTTPVVITSGKSEEEMLDTPGPPDCCIKIAMRLHDEFAAYTRERV